MRRRNLIAPLSTAVVFVCSLLALATYYEYVVYFHEQHHLFRFSWDYCTYTVHEKGIWYLLAEFVAQFGYYPFLGAIAWAAVITAIYALCRNAFRRLTGWRDMLQLSAIPAVWAFFGITEVDVLPTLPVKTLAATLALWLLSTVLSRFVAPLKRRYNAPSSPCKPWLVVGSCLLPLAYFAAGYYLSISPRDISLPSGKTMHQDRKGRMEQQRLERDMIRAERALKIQDYDTLLRLSDAQVATGKKNHLMTYFRSMALYHKGLLLTNFFDHPMKYGTESLFFPWTADRNRAEFGGYVYEQLGAVNTANHWAFEAMVGWGETAWHLTALARYSIANGKPEQAEKFIRPLRQSLFYRSTARALTDQLAKGEVEGLRHSLKNTPQTPARFDNVVNIGADLRYIMLADPQNDMAREYLMVHFLLANNLGVFYRNLKEFWPQPPGEYMPPVIDQALCLVRLNYGPERLAEDGYSISPATDALFSEYCRVQQQGGKQAFFPPKLRRTLWYYLTHVSPHGDKIVF